MEKHSSILQGTSRPKKEATTAAQFELLISEMKKYPDVARGTCSTGRLKVKGDRVWNATSKLLNEIGPPYKNPSKWRKTWTDLRGRLRKKLLETNKARIPQSGGQLSEHFELTPFEQAIDIIVNTNEAANISDPAYDEDYSPPIYEVSDTLSSECFHQSQMSFSPPVQASLKEEGNELYAFKTTTKMKISKKQSAKLKKRRQDVKSQERKKLIKLIEKQTQEMSKITVALGKLTAAVEAQTKIFEQKFK